MAAPQGIYHSGSKDYLGDKATMLSSRWTHKQQNTSPRFKHEKRVLWFDFFNFFWDWGHFFIACLKNIICTKQYFCCLLLILPYQPKTRTESLILTKMHWQNLFLQHLKLGCASQNVWNWDVWDALWRSSSVLFPSLPLIGSLLPTGRNNCTFLNTL